MIEVSNPTIVTPSHDTTPVAAPTKEQTAELMGALGLVASEPDKAPAADVVASVEPPAAITIESLDRGRFVAYLNDLLQQGDKQLTTNGNHGEVQIAVKIKLTAEDGSFLRKIVSVAELKLGKLERQEFRTDAASKGNGGLTLWTPKAAVAQAEADTEKAEKKKAKSKAKKGEPVPDVPLPLETPEEAPADASSEFTDTAAWQKAAAKRTAELTADGAISSVEG